MSDVVRRFAEDRWTAAVIGLGYVGLPLLIAASRRGLGAIGFDVSPGLVGDLNAGLSHVDDVSNEDLKTAIEEGAEFTSDSARLSEADAIFLCVPSPLGRNRQPALFASIDFYFKRYLPCFTQTLNIFYHEANL